MKTLTEPVGGKAVDQRRRLVLAVPLLGLAASQAWAGGGPGAPSGGGASELLQSSRLLMGTRVDMSVSLHSASIGRADAELAMDAAFARMQRLEALLSRFRGDSDIARIGEAAGRSPVRVSPQTMVLLEHAKAMHRHSGGAFDITIGALSRGWSFEPGHQQAPGKAEISQALSLVNMRQLELDPLAGTAWLRQGGMALDLGGIAKLPILQAGLNSLRDAGISNALINGGGDVLISGANQGQPWRIGVRDPNAPQQLLGAIELQGRGVVASSGDYERAFMRDGKLLHHVLDPKSGWPTQGVHGVALVAGQVEAVNGWGTALMVGGQGSLSSFARRHPDVAVMAGISDGSHWYAGDMKQRLKPLAATRRAA